MSSSWGSDGGPGRPRALDAVDPAFLGQLIARHGAPRQAPPVPFAEQERRQIVARRERAMAAADRALIHHLERHERDAGALRHLPAADPVPERPSIARFDLDAWPLPAQPRGEPRELEPSEELRRALGHRTPQAFLRDLHRPVYAFGRVELRRVPSGTSVSVALARVRSAIAGAMVHHGRADAVQPLATRLMNEGMAELRTILARPWADSRPENPLPMPGTLPGVEDSAWFGLSGGYDPDV
ncbi:MAG TPA: hypothetical protein VFU21_29110 [Kofleriaceae bacterium]|nr:hypothetical protein [Kofleriaceae bacterium]